MTDVLFCLNPAPEQCVYGVAIYAKFMQIFLKKITRFQLEKLSPKVHLWRKNVKYEVCRLKKKKKSNKQNMCTNNDKQGKKCVCRV